MSRLSSRDAIVSAAAAWVSRRDAGLTPEQADQLQRWLAADPRHASAFEHYAGAWSVLDRASDRESTEAVLCTLRDRSQRRRRRRLGVGAAVLICGLFAVTMTRPSATPPDDPPYPTVAHAGVIVSPEVRTLEDNSIVELNRGAVIAVEFTAESRRVVLLRGEAHFQVTKDPARPFSVDAGRVQVRAVGTAFSVQRDDRQIDVFVTEGQIAVERVPPADADAAPATPATGTLATLDAGKRISLPAATRLEVPPEVIAVTAEEAGERLAWRAPRVEFSETPLADAVALMNRAARTDGAPQLVLEPVAGRLAREPVSGVFRADNTEAFVRMLELSLGVQTERRGHQLVMRRPE